MAALEGTLGVVGVAEPGGGEGGEPLDGDRARGPLGDVAAPLPGVGKAVSGRVGDEPRERARVDVTFHRDHDLGGDVVGAEEPLHVGTPKGEQILRDPLVEPVRVVGGEHALHRLVVHQHTCVQPLGGLGEHHAGLGQHVVVLDALEVVCRHRDGEAHGERGRVGRALHREDRGVQPGGAVHAASRGAEGLVRGATGEARAEGDVLREVGERSLSRGGIRRATPDGHHHADDREARIGTVKHDEPARQRPLGGARVGFGRAEGNQREEGARARGQGHRQGHPCILRLRRFPCTHGARTEALVRARISGPRW
ncbi:MAG: hypothetical protein V4850_08435 [Myxococcota bacterium]